MMQMHYNLTPLCSDTHFQLKHYRYLPRPAELKGADEGTVVGRMFPDAMCEFYESIHGIHHDVTSSAFHNDWLDTLAECVRLASEPTTPPAPVAEPKVADLRKKERWRHIKEDGATVVEFLNYRRRSQAKVWAAMFSFSDGSKDDDSSLMDIVVAGAGASKDCDSPFIPATPSKPASRLVAARN